MLFIYVLQYYKNGRSVGLFPPVSQGGIIIPRFSDGVFSKIQWGWRPLDGVSIKWMEFKWGWLKVNGVVLKVSGVDFRWGSYRG